MGGLRGYGLAVQRLNPGDVELEGRRARDRPGADLAGEFPSRDERVHGRVMGRAGEACARGNKAEYSLV